MKQTPESPIWEAPVFCIVVDVTRTNPLDRIDELDYL
ncbi:hypothetical protein DFQ01_105137 [Paenibacillus cellulosilyticus]|uniref:Uncharacterized protein n=1 Tax=Paenibacillus cellulosilyticus TaxID=375489 RepID=A0A2V2YV35_9BACL|nr:hypothetical protein DFQ01_105137 [Paenibacillus cellulosilyticus]